MIFFLPGILFGIIIGVRIWENVRTPQIVWGVCSFSGDEFLEDWQKGFNELLREKGIRVRVKFVVNSLGWEQDDWVAAAYQEYGDSFADMSGDCDIITDCGQLGYYCSYPNFIKKGIYEELSPYFDTVRGQELRNSYPDLFWEAVTFDRGIYGIPSQRNLYFTDYYVFKKEFIDCYGIDVEKKSEMELLDLAQELAVSMGHGDVSDPRGVPFRDIYAPEGCEALPGSLPFFVFREEGKIVLENKTDNEEYMETLKRLHELHEAGIWSDTIDLSRTPYFFAVPVSSYSPEAAVEQLCGAYGWNPDDHVAVRIGERPFRLTGNTTGINRRSEKKEQAFEVLALAFSDEELANYLAYGRLGKDYQWEQGVVRRKNKITEKGEIDPLSMTNQLLVYPAECDAAEKRELLPQYYEALPKSVLLGKWADHDGIWDEVQTLSQFYEDGEYFFWGISERFEEEYGQWEEYLRQPYVEELREELEKRFNRE